MGQLAGDRRTPTGESSPSESSFQDRARERLGAEKGRPPPIAGEDDRDRNPPDAHQPDNDRLKEPEGYPGESLDRLDDEHDDDPNRLDDEFDDEDDLDGDPDDLDAEPGVDDDPDAEGDDDLSEDARDWKAKAEQADDRANNMLSDYTRKMQGIARTENVLQPMVEVNRAVKVNQLQDAKRFLDQHENQDWQNLQRTLDPAEYQKRLQSRNQAVQLYQRAEQQLQTYYDQSEQQLIEARNQRSRLSGEILKGSIPGWGKDKYSELRTFAVDTLGFSADEFGTITDHKLLELIHFRMGSANPGKSVLRETRRGKKRRPGRRTKDRSSRGEDGRYRNLEKHRRENPGDHDASRESFRLRLKRERKRR